ncbi:MAG: LD-carboxypeptidase [FCB group bacterium]|jgi:muramoyltetrapeptide carboxypeptidase
MEINRRDFFSFIAGSALFASHALFGKTKIVNETLNDFNYQTKDDAQEKVILPKALKKGSLVAITAPASYTNIIECREAINYFKNMGCKVEIGNTLNWNHIKYKYFSAPDEERASEFMKFVTRDDVDCILCARGGYGVMRILPMIDFSEIRKHPKIIIGFSDITALINSVYCLSNVVSFHGSVASTSFNIFSKTHLTDVIFEKKNFTTQKIKYPTIQTINKGVAEGILVGGNLSMITSTLGTPYEISTKGNILLIEEVSEEPYKIDRMLTQLWLAGKLQDCAGIAFGYFKNLETKRDFYPGHSFTIREIISNRVKQLGIPAILGMPFGHTSDNITLPLGVPAQIDATNKTFTILSKAVS